MTQMELAKKSRVSQTTISQIENGKRNPTIVVMMRISKALDEPITTFCDTENSQPA